MDRTLLVDSEYLFKRSLNGAKNIATGKFGMIGGLYSFITTIRMLVSKYNINKVVLAWDGENSGFYRHIIDNGYKANRKNKQWHTKIHLTEAEIEIEEKKALSELKQRKRIQAYCEELFFRQIESDRVEGDDIIYEYCRRYSKNEDILLFTNDRDLIQTLDFDINILFGNKEDVINKHNFMMYFDYYYSNITTIKIICGDMSDNIKGIDGCGEKTLLKYFPDMKFRKFTVNEIYNLAKSLNDERVIKKQKPYKAFVNLLENKQQLIINHKLVDLNQEGMLDEDVLEQFYYLDSPLSDENRNSKNLYNMMIEDEFLNIYNGTFTNYVKPFYSVIINEKNKLKQ